MLEHLHACLSGVCAQAKVRGVLEREQEEIVNMHEKNYRQLQKAAAK